MWRRRGLLLVSVLLTAVLRQPSPTGAWQPDDLDLVDDHDHDHDHDNGHDHDHDHDHDRHYDHDDDHDLDLDLDDDDLDLDDDFLRKGGIKRLRLPGRFRNARAGGAGGGAGDGAGDGIEGWDADLEKMLHAESPWLSGADGGEGYEDFVRRFASEAPPEDQETLDDWD